jgi:hypothetical protein
MSETFDNGNPTPPSTGDRWTPIRNGDVFCAPACGNKCKLADFERATASAAALVAELGDGWQPRVWENLGWYFSAEKGTASVGYSEGGGHFTASIDAGIFQQRHEQFRAAASSPRAAMEAVLAEVEHKIAALRRTAISAALEPLKITAAV